MTKWNVFANMGNGRQLLENLRKVFSYHLLVTTGNINGLVTLKVIMDLLNVKDNGHYLDKSDLIFKCMELNLSQIMGNK
jgi:hypothetical protein